MQGNKKFGEKPVKKKLRLKIKERLPPNLQKVREVKRMYVAGFREGQGTG